MSESQEPKSKKVTSADTATSYQEATQLELDPTDMATNSASAASQKQKSEEFSTADVKVVDVEQGIREPSSASTTEVDLEKDHGSNRDQDGQASAAAGVHDNASFEQDAEKEKVEIKFFGSELIRAKFPKSFEVAEAVATDWVNNGEFDKLPIEHPLAQFAAQKGLHKAKEVEKIVLESPVTEKVAMQMFTAGLKAHSLFEQFRARIKKD